MTIFDKKKQTTKTPPTPQKKLLFIALGCLGFIIFYIVVISLFRSTQATHAASQVNTTKASFTSRYKYLHKLELQQKEAEQLKKIYKEKSLTLPKANKLRSTLERITRLTEENKLKLIRFKPKGEKPGKNYNILPVQISAAGRYNHIKAFIEQIADMDILIVVQELRMIKHDDDTNNIHLNMTLAIYYQKPKQEDK